MKQKKIREYRTRPDPFADVSGQIAGLLECDNSLEAKTILGWLQQEYPGRFNDGQLRTLQRRVRDWRTTKCPAPRQPVLAPEVQPPSSQFTYEYLPFST